MLEFSFLLILDPILDSSQYYPNGYISNGIVINNEDEGLLHVNQMFGNGHHSEVLQCCLKRMKKQGYSQMFQDDVVLLRCLFKDDVLIHCMPFDSSSNQNVYNQEDIIDEISFFQNATSQSQVPMYTRTLISRLLYDSSIRRRNVTRFVDFQKDGCGFILFSPPFDQLYLSVEWKEGKLVGTGHLVDLVSNHIMEKITFVNNCIQRVEVFLMSKLRNKKGIERIIIPVGSCFWRGTVMNDCANGYGELTNDKGVMIYQGLMIDNKREGYGSSYSPVTKSLEYKGMWRCDKRHGHGKTYSEDGTVEIDGTFCEDEISEKQVICKDGESFMMTPFVEFLYIGDHCLNGFSSFSMYSLRALSLLRIGSHSLENVQSFTLSDFDVLRSVIIGNSCFTCQTSPDRGVLLISGNPQLADISIGEGSFLHYTNCSLVHLPLLKSLSIGTDLNMEVLLKDEVVTCEAWTYEQRPPSLMNAFNPATSVIMEDLPSLESFCLSKNMLNYVPSFSFSSSITQLVFGRNSANSIQSIDFSCMIVISSSPLAYQTLKEIKIGENSLSVLTDFSLINLSDLKSVILDDSCIRSVHQLAIENCPRLSYLSFGESVAISAGSVSLINLPQLKALYFFHDSFVTALKLTLKDMPSLELLGFYPYCFSKCVSLELVDFPSLKSLEIGDFSFSVVDEVIIDNLPKCTRLEFGQSSCKGEDGVAFKLKS